MSDSGLEGRRRVGEKIAPLDPTLGLRYADSPSSNPGQSFDEVQPETTAAFSNAKPFAYPPLYLRHPAAFRLLDLHPGDEGDGIKCTLRQGIRTNIRWRRMYYSALSYTWGNEPAVIPITVNESTFFVTLNLATALQGLRNSPKFGGKRTLWVDAICINQGDVNERNHQVAQMQEIYSGAQEVIVWLGPADSTIKLAISFIHDLCEHFSEHKIFFGDDVNLKDYTLTSLGHALEKVTTNLYQQKWCAVVEMLLKRWWTRVWVIQEFGECPSGYFTMWKVESVLGQNGSGHRDLTIMASISDCNEIAARPLSHRGKSNYESSKHFLYQNIIPAGKKGRLRKANRIIPVKPMQRSSRQSLCIAWINTTGCQENYTARLRQTHRLDICNCNQGTRSLPRKSQYPGTYLRK